MFRKKTFLSFILLVTATLIISSTGSLTVHAATDSEGYEYTLSKAEDLDFSKDDIYTSLVSGNPKDGDAVYAVYTAEELEKYEEDHPGIKQSSYESINNPITLFAISSKGFSYYYKTSKWITRNKIVSLSVDPKANAWTGSSIAGNAFKQKDRFDVLAKKHSSSSKWKNPSSLKAQLNCHADLAKSIKTPWNLEPHYPNVNYALLLKNRCNLK